MAERMTDEQLEDILRRGIEEIYDVSDMDADEAEPVPVPPELRERIIAKAAKLSGMMAAAEARSDGAEINGWVPSPGADAEHYWLTPGELQDFIKNG